MDRITIPEIGIYELEKEDYQLLAEQARVYLKLIFNQQRISQNISRCLVLVAWTFPLHHLSQSVNADKMTGILDPAALISWGNRCRFAPSCVVCATNANWQIKQPDAVCVICRHQKGSGLTAGEVNTPTTMI